MPTSAWDVEWQGRIIEVMGRLPGKNMEIGVHPGYAEDWRDLERRSVQEFAQKAKAAGHELIGWKDL